MDLAGTLAISWWIFVCLAGRVKTELNVSVSKMDIFVSACRKQQAGIARLISEPVDVMISSQRIREICWLELTRWILQNLREIRCMNHFSKIRAVYLRHLTISSTPNSAPLAAKELKPAKIYWSEATNVSAQNLTVWWELTEMTAFARCDPSISKVWILT